MRVSSFVLGALLASATAHAGPYAPAKRPAGRGPAQAAQGAPTAQAKGPSTMQVAAPAYRTQYHAGHYTTLDRASLPAAPAQRIQVLKKAMEDEILKRGDFAQHGGANPPFEIVHGALKEIRPSSGEQTHVIYELPASALKGGKLDVSFLLPVSGHVSAADTESFRQHNEYNIVVNGAARPRVPAAGDYVRQHDTSIELKPGSNRIELWAQGSIGVVGYPAGRIIEIVVK
jgi:hypothetical protein